MLNRLSLLTPREIEVIEAPTDGHSTTKIASLLGISTSTVRTHVKSLLIKLGLHSRVEAVSVILRSNGGPLRSETAQSTLRILPKGRSPPRHAHGCRARVEHRIDVGFEAITP